MSCAGGVGKDDWKANRDRMIAEGRVVWARRIDIDCSRPAVRPDREVDGSSFLIDIMGEQGSLTSANSIAYILPFWTPLS